MSDSEETQKILNAFGDHSRASKDRHQELVEKLDKHEDLLFGKGADDLGMRGRVATLWRENRQRNKWMLGAVSAVVVLVAKDAWFWVTSQGAS